MRSIRAPLVKPASVMALALALISASPWHSPAQGGTTSQTLTPGPVSFSITNSAAPVYDLTGSYQFDQELRTAGGRPLRLGLVFAVEQDAAGRLSGSGVTNMVIGGETVAASYRVSGRVSGGGSRATRAMFSIRCQAQGTAGTNGPFTLSVQCNLEVKAGLLNGQTRGRARFARLGSGNLNTPISGVAVSAGRDGSWSVAMNIQRSAGTGTITLANGRSVQTSLNQNFAARTGLASLKLAGAGKDRGTALNVSFSPSSGVLVNVSGKVLGQTIGLAGSGGTVVSQSAARTASSFAGTQACLECHTPIQVILNGNRHGQAGVQCEGCHGPAANHAANEYDPIARPRALTTFSTNDYFLNPADLLASHYDTTVNLCARCHNHFGASWTNSSAPPPPSPQYNMLLGTVGELDPPATPYDPSYHALYITNQCIGCHMQPAPGSNPSVTGHRLVFDSYGVCAGCHGTAANASNLVVFVANKVITPRIETLHASLDLWATTKAPPTLTAKYGTRAWEYTTPGALSPGGPGPDAVEQTLIPVNIQKARFNLYLVLYDGSVGTHNGSYAITLLDTAQNWVYFELMR